MTATYLMHNGNNGKYKKITQATFKKPPPPKKSCLSTAIIIPAHLHFQCYHTKLIEIKK